MMLAVLDHGVTLAQHFEVATDLLPFLRGYVGDRGFDVGISASGVSGDVLEQHVVAPSEFTQEPVVCLAF